MDVTGIPAETIGRYCNSRDNGLTEVSAMIQCNISVDDALRIEELYRQSRALPPMDNRNLPFKIQLKKKGTHDDK